DLDSCDADAYGGSTFSLDARGDGGTGWSKPRKINFCARLHDGDRVHKLLGEQRARARCPRSAYEGKAVDQHQVAGSIAHRGDDASEDRWPGEVASLESRVCAAQPPT